VNGAVCTNAFSLSLRRLHHQHLLTKSFFGGGWGGIEMFTYTSDDKERLMCNYTYFLLVSQMQRWLLNTCLHSRQRFVRSPSEVWAIWWHCLWGLGVQQRLNETKLPHIDLLCMGHNYENLQTLNVSSNKEKQKRILKLQCRFFCMSAEQWLGLWASVLHNTISLYFILLFRYFHCSN
jgi:hypothetical protein